MSNPSFTTSPVPASWDNPDHPDFLAGFHFECACGEQYRSVQAASSCRKCRVYTYQGYCTHVTDTRTNEVVWGEEPTAEEQEAVAMEWESMRAIENREHELMCQMWAREGELYEAEMARRAEADRQQRREEEEDQQWYIQDLLMGVA